MKQHMNVLADPDLKNDPELVSRVLNHIQEHLELLRTTDPNLLMINGEQPLAPQGAPAANQPSPDQMVNEGQLGNNPQAQMPEGMASNELPVDPAQPARPPGEFANLPVTAEEMVQGNNS
jgi:hypothetical protein